MARVSLITERSDDLDETQRRVFDRIVASRGRMIRPFEVLLHTPEIGEAIAEVGARLRFGSSLPDHDRELLTLVVGVAHGCAFVWDSHMDLARSAGVREVVLEFLRGGPQPDLTELEKLIITSVRDLCATATMPSARFDELRDHYGDVGAVEIATTVGYYTLLGYVMGATDACD
jgi:4-carboxymuconolactone decarboxylase